MAIKIEKFIKTKTSVNLRSAPTTDGKVLGVKPAGTVLQVIGPAAGTWHKVKTEQGTVGYMTSKPEYVEDFVPAWAIDALKLIEYGNSKLNVDGKHPYVLGSTRTNEVSFDCSDFVQWCYDKVLGIKLGWDSRSQAYNGVAVTKDQLRTGDTVHFDNEGGYTGKQDIDHVAFYVYPDLLLHTYNDHCDVKNRDLVTVAKGKGGVTWTRFSGYWENRAREFRRHIKK